MKKEPSKIFLYAVAVTFALCIGFSFFGIKKCVPYGDTLTIITYRYIAALIATVIWITVMKLLNAFPKSEIVRPKKKLYQTAVFYIAFMVFQILSMFFATSIEGALVYAMVPIFAKIIGRVVLGERSTRLQMLLVVMTVAALIVLILLNATSVDMNPLGIIFITIATFFMGCNNVSARYVRGVFSPIEITLTISIMGSIFFISASIIRALVRDDFQALIEPLHHADFIIWASFLGVCCILISAQAMSYMLAHMEIVQASIFHSVSTFISIIAGALILQEPLFWYHYVCGTVIIACVIGLLFAPSEAANAGKSLTDDMNKEQK